MTSPPVIPSLSRGEKAEMDPDSGYEGAPGDQFSAASTRPRGLCRASNPSLEPNRSLKVTGCGRSSYQVPAGTLTPALGAQLATHTAELVAYLKQVGEAPRAPSRAGAVVARGARHATGL